MVNIFQHFTGLRGFHVYSNLVNRKSHFGQKIYLKHEHNNNYDKFAVPCKTLFK